MYPRGYVCSRQDILGKTEDLCPYPLESAVTAAQVASKKRSRCISNENIVKKLIKYMVKIVI